jgi:predicted secreted protein
MAVPEILAGILLVAIVVKFKRKTPIYWVLVILGAYGVFKYFNRFEHLTGEARTKRLAEIEKDITYLKSVGITESSSNETMKKLLAERNTLNPPSPEDQKTKRLAEIEKDITYLKSVGLTETSDNETMKKLVAERNSLNAPAAPVSVSAPAPAKVPEKQIPWSLCSIEKRGVL